MNFGNAELDEKSFQALGDLLRKPDGIDFIKSLLDEAVRFPIKNSSVLEDRLWEIWSDWFRKQQVDKKDLPGFMARIILGLIAELLVEAKAGADNLTKAFGLVEIFFGKKN